MHPTREAIARLFSDGRERTVTDVCASLHPEALPKYPNRTKKFQSQLSAIRSHMTEMRKMGLLSREWAEGGVAIYRRAQ